MGYIYALTHPVTDEIRYIGKTIVSIDLRLSRHKAQSNIGKSHVKSWIKFLKQQGLNPRITVIEECNNSVLNDREIYWITYYSDKANLCNITKGGEGGSRNNKYAISIQNKIIEVLELVNKGVKLVDAEEQIGLPNGYLSRARTGKIQFINDNNILVPKLSKSPNNKKKVIDDRTGAIYDSLEKAATALSIHKKTVYNMIKSNRHLRISK